MGVGVPLDAIPRCYCMRYSVSKIKFGKRFCSCSSQDAWLTVSSHRALFVNVSASSAPAVEQSDGCLLCTAEHVADPSQSACAHCQWSAGSAQMLYEESAVCLLAHCPLLGNQSSSYRSHIRQVSFSEGTESSRYRHIFIPSSFSFHIQIGSSFQTPDLLVDSWTIGFKCPAAPPSIVRLSTQLQFDTYRADVFPHRFEGLYLTTNISFWEPAYLCCTLTSGRQTEN